MALHSVDDSLLTEWDNWSRQSPKYKPRDCEKKWKSFKRSGVAIGTLAHMAKQDGWRSPFERPEQSASLRPRKLIGSLATEPKLSTVERFKADLLALANSDDDLERLVRINELASTYRMPASEIRKALSKTEVGTRTPKAQTFRLDEFLSMETEGIDYLIPGLLPRAETVLCVGLPKSGKTLLTIDAAFAVATGESKFLGETVQQGKVLIVSVDESPQSTKLKLLKRGFRASDAENVAVMTTWDVSQMAELEAKLEDFRPDLVIIDSLKRITAGREISENSAEFADVVYQLKELLGRYGAAGILIHHSNKSQEAVGVGKVRGSTAIAGACWGVWQLDHIIQTTDENGKPIKGKPKFDPSDPRRTFSAICRDADSQALMIEFNPENHSYFIAAEDSEAQQERKTQEALILGLLKTYHPSGLTGREIMEALGLGRGAYTILDRMVGRKTVTQRQSKVDRRSMVYALPKKRDTHPPSPSLQMLTNFSESTVVEPKTNSQQIVNNESTDSQRRFDQSETVDYSIPEQMDVSGDSQQLLATERGCVSPLSDVLDSTVTTTPDYAIIPDPWEECTPPLTNVDADGWEEVVRKAPAPMTADEVDQAEVEPEAEREWRRGDRVTVETDIASLQTFNGRQGVVEVVKAGTCLVDFGNNEFMHIPFKGLRSNQNGETNVTGKNAG
jgi:KaiC/GvpD/RAD55 family RecA-like ATPase